jgi:hypothetical protein
MTDVGHAKPPAPPVTRVVQLIGLGAVVFGTWVVVDARDCEELGCLATFLGAMGAAWGVIALLAGLRNLVGFFCLIAAVILALLTAWATPLFTLPFLVVVLILIRFSKDKLKAFYRGSSGEAS